MTGDDPLAADRLAAMRAQYSAGGLDESELAPTWIDQLRRWLDDAGRHGILEPNAMVLATSGADGAVSARTVLLKGASEAGLVFFTNYDSRKARQLAEHPRAAIVFPWHALQRQVHLEGPVERIAAADSDSYWASRPRKSQISATISAQSRVVGSRRELEGAYAALERGSGDAPIPRPEHWGGFRVAPETVEFWQGRRDRLHDRLRFRREGEAWVVERLAP